MKQTLPMAVLSLCAVSGAAASDLVYAPLSTQFGASPHVGAQLLSQAQATNKHKDAPALSQQGSLQQFNDSLSRSILGHLASAATSSIIGSNGKLQPGTVQTGNFRITITDLGGGTLQITTVDKVTNDSTTFMISQGGGI